MFDDVFVGVFVGYDGVEMKLLFFIGLFDEFVGSQMFDLFEFVKDYVVWWFGCRSFGYFEFFQFVGQKCCFGIVLFFFSDLFIGQFIDVDFCWGEVYFKQFFSQCCCCFNVNWFMNNIFCVFVKVQ